MKLVVLAGAKTGAAVPIKKDRFIIGRGKDCTLRAGSEAISRNHCELLVTESGVTVRDMGSRNGTYVNDEKIEGVKTLSNGDKLRAFRDQLNDEYAHDAGAHVEITCDLSNAKQVEELIPATVDTLGSMNILVNNAGITRDNLAMRMKDEEWDDVIRINLEASFRLMRASARPMMKAKGGRIISITSVVGHTGNPGQMNYTAAKGGLTAMSKSLAQELASRNITVNCVAPGFIRTAMTDALTDDQKGAINARIPMGRMGEGEEIAAAVAYLASDEAAYVTGQTLHVNGGMAMI